MSEARAVETRGTGPGRGGVAREIAVSREPVAARRGLIRVGTRGSALAVTQTRGVAERIAEATGHEVVLVIITTSGDVSRAPLAQLGGTGVFVSALRDALIAGACDVAVHSLKDLPTGRCPGIALGAVPERADPLDALCSRDGLGVSELPIGARVGTGSPRRAAQLLARRPDLEVTELRGNVETRLGRIHDDLDAVVLAVAGLVRLGRGDAITERLAPEFAPPAAGQGALAVETREPGPHEDPALAAALELAMAALDEPGSRLTALAEQGVLGALNAGCAAPVGTWARLEGDSLHLTATVYREDGAEQVAADLVRQLPDATRATGAAGREAIDEWAAVVGGEVAASLLGRGAAELAPRGTIGAAR